MPSTSRKPIYAVATFIRTKDGFAMERHQHAPGEASARRLAERFATSCAGSVAYCRYGDPEIGEFDEPIEVARFGTLPQRLLIETIGLD